MITTELIKEVLDDLWIKYYDSGKKTFKPPSLDKIIKTLTDRFGLEYGPTRKEVKAILNSGQFVRTTEKDNCGISWKVYCALDSQHLNECLNSPNRVRED